MLPFRFWGLPENGCVAGKNVRPQTHRTLRYTIAHLFRVRLCNRSYVTEKAVRLPQNYERPSSYVKTWYGLHHSILFEILSFREICFFSFSTCTSASCRKFNFRRRCPLDDEEYVLPCIDDSTILCFQRILNVERTGAPRCGCFRNVISVEACN